MDAILLSVLFFVTKGSIDGVFSILLEPSPTAKFRKYSSNAIECSVSENWISLIFTIQPKGELSQLVAFFTDSNGRCKDNIAPTEQYQTGCDYSTSKFQLTITNVTDAHDGSLLICTVNYNQPSGRLEKANTTLDVQYSPISPPSITQTPGKPVIEGNKVVFSCKIARGNPLASITWRCDGFSTVTTTTAPTTDKVVSSVEHIVTREDNNKECTCIGNHMFWTEDKVVKHRLSVYYRPTVTISPNYAQYEVIENTTNLVLDCTVTDANPAVTSYRWYKDGSIIDGSNGASYTIPIVLRSHTERYTCDATNSAGSSDPSSDVQLIVLYGVDINLIGNKKPAESTQLSVSCNVTSYPEVTSNDVTWTKKNNVTFSRKGQQLVIGSVQRIDSGTYICSVVITLTPTIGQPVKVTGTTTVEVNVLYRPAVTVSPDYMQYNVIENTTNLHLTCNVTDANPAVTSYRWYKGSSIISNDATYTIPTVQRSQTGTYTCDAANFVGSSLLSSAVQLNVLYGVDIRPIGNKKPHEGTQITITCSGQSNPEMTSSDVKWLKQNNNTFIREGLPLVIDNVNRLDSGIYVCFVLLHFTPTVGQPVNVTGSTTVEVNVLYRPDVTVSPDIHSYRVMENTTILYLTCIIKDANPAVTSYGWYKNGNKVSTSAIYIISTVSRSHTGNYTCDATNVVGRSDPTSELHLDVLYGVSLKLSETEIMINESERWDLTCIGDGNPRPQINCVINHNGTLVGEQKANVTYISVDHANCVDTGLYICSGNNTIGAPFSLSADIKVACKPRTYNNLDKVDIFMRATDESINISTTFISIPLSYISWSRELPNGYLADLDSNFKYFTIPSHLPYETIAILQKDQLKPNEFGIYLVNASNIYGSFVMKYHFIQKRDPIPPSYVYVVCKSTTAIVILKPNLNEYVSQDFYIQHTIGQDMTSIKVHINDTNQPIEYTVTGLNPGGKYNFSILAVNPFGETRSNQVECVTDTLSFEQDVLALKEDNSGMFSAGIASLVVALLFFVAATIFIFRKRFKKTYTKSYKSDEYSDLQTSNPAFQDPYTSLQTPIESRYHQEPSANTYEECGNASDAAAYQNIENMKSGHRKAEKNMGIYDNMKI